MSLLPFLIELHRPGRLPDQQFAMALTPEDLLTAVAPSPGNFYRPWTQLSSILRDAGSTIKTDRQMFQVTLDVQHFRPEEVTVKVTDGFVVVEGRHEEKKDQHGFVSRQFTRRYALPKACDAEGVQSSLSSDGVLTITAPLVTPEGNERVVPIARTGPVKTDGQGAAAAAAVGNGEPEAAAAAAVANGQ